MKLIHSIFTKHSKKKSFEMPVDLNQIITRVGKLLLSKDVVVLCGAGISRNSGFPLADELKCAILREIFKNKDNKADVESILSSSMPFEKFIECITSSLSIYDEHNKNWNLDYFLSSIFKDPEYLPNANHMFLSKLAKHGFLKILSTTNFDILFEKALKSEGLQPQKGYNKYSSPRELYSYHQNNSYGSKTVDLLKLHGCAESGYIAATLDRVSDPVTAFPLDEIIEQLFSKGRHKAVLILGYSCSDIFDIMPKIRNITQKRKEIIYIQHSDNVKIKYVKSKKEGNPFHDFPCTIVQCNTDDLITRIWESLKQKIGRYEKVKVSQNISWKREIKKWGSCLKDEFLINYIKGSLYLEMPKYSLATICFEQAYNYIKETEQLQSALNCCIALIDAYLFQGDHEKLLPYITKTIQIFNEIQNKWEQEKLRRISVKGIGRNYSFIMIESVINIKIGEALLLEAEGNAKQAKEYFEKALKIEEKIAWDRERVFTCHAKLSKCYAQMRDFEKAHEFCNMLKNNNPFKSSVYFACKGYIHNKCKEYEQALKAYKESLYLDEITGNIYGQAENSLNLGDVYDELCNIEKTLFYYSKAIEISERIGAKLLASKGYGYLGFFYFNVGQFDLSLENHNKCLKIENQLKFRPREGISYMNVASAYAKLGDFKNAISNYLMAEKILKDTGQSRIMSQLYSNLSLAYQRAGDYEKSEKYRYMDL